MNWKTFGATFTKKALFYAVVITVAFFAVNGSFNLLSEKDTMMNLLGLILAILTVSGVVTVIAREVNYYTKTKQ